MKIRAEHRAECVEILDEIFASRSFEEWRAVFDEETFPWAPFLRVPELVADRQVAANGYIGEVPTPAAEDRSGCPPGRLSSTRSRRQ